MSEKMNMRRAPEPPETIAGTLAYMAPEQTGRMNRSIDARSDLYALGVTRYQIHGRSALHGDRSERMGALPYCKTTGAAQRAVKKLPGSVSAIIMSTETQPHRQLDLQRDKRSVTSIGRTGVTGSGDLIRCRAFQVDKVCGNAFTQRTAIECGERFRRPCTRKEISWPSSDSSYLME